MDSFRPPKCNLPLSPKQTDRRDREMSVVRTSCQLQLKLHCTESTERVEESLTTMLTTSASEMHFGELLQRKSLTPGILQRRTKVNVGKDRGGTIQLGNEFTSYCTKHTIQLNMAKTHVNQSQRQPFQRNNAQYMRTWRHCRFSRCYACKLHNQRHTEGCTRIWRKDEGTIQNDKRRDSKPAWQAAALHKRRQAAESGAKECEFGK